MTSRTCALVAIGDHIVYIQIGWSMKVEGAGFAGPLSPHTSCCLRFKSCVYSLSVCVLACFFLRASVALALVSWASLRFPLLVILQWRMCDTTITLVSLFSFACVSLGILYLILVSAHFDTQAQHSFQALLHAQSQLLWCHRRHS